MEAEAIPIPMICPRCGNAAPADAAFCPRCGAPLWEAPLPTTIFTQIWIYLLSIFLPPLGLWPGIKYVRRGNAKAKQVGWIAIALTVISTVATLWLMFAFLNLYLNTLTQSLGGIQ